MLCFSESSGERSLLFLNAAPSPTGRSCWKLKLQTKTLLAIASQVLILVSSCIGLFKLCFWKLLTSPRSTTQIWETNSGKSLFQCFFERIFKKQPETFQTCISLQENPLRTQAACPPQFQSWCGQHTTMGLSLAQRSTARSPDWAQSVKFFFLLKRSSPLNKREKEQNREKGSSEMRVSLALPWWQTQVWTWWALGLVGSRDGEA